MKTLTVFLLFCALSSIQAQEIFVPRQLKAMPLQSSSAGCQEVSANMSADYSGPNFVPYRRLVAADFRIDDKDQPGSVMTTSSFFYPDFKMKCSSTGSRFTAKITNWKITSVFNRRESSRKSWFTDLKRGLIHEQGHFDITELHAKKLQMQRLPEGYGGTPAEAMDDLVDKILSLLTAAWDDLSAEQAAYDKRTDGSKNHSEQKKATASIRERLNRAGIRY